LRGGGHHPDSGRESGNADSSGLDKSHALASGGCTRAACMTFVSRHINMHVHAGYGTGTEVFMERKRISASNIRSVGFDSRNRVLEIEFSSGSIIQYSGVSDEVHRRFVNAPSPGSYFQDNIEENFTARRVR
jgi:hypothetical protein